MRKIRDFSPSVDCLEDRQLLSGTYQVTNLNSSGGGSLAGAVQWSNATPSTPNSPNTITFAQGLNGQIHTAGTPIVITNNVNIEGPGNGLMVNGDARSQVFVVGGVQATTISGLTIAGGNANGTYAGQLGGGAILDYAASLWLTNDVIVENQAVDGGGAVEVIQVNGQPASVLVLTNDTIDNNFAGYGSAIYAVSTQANYAPVYLNGGDTIANNTAYSQNYSADAAIWTDSPVYGSANFYGNVGYRGVSAPSISYF